MDEIEFQDISDLVSTGAEEGIRLERKLRPQLITLDVVMPGMDGWAVLHVLKSDPELADIPVIMISALDDLDSVIRCIEAGAVDYLFKPFDATLLRARIGSSMENRTCSVLTA